MAKPMQKERENRSAEKKDLTFHSFTITPATAYTSILLLESTEPEILCQTLRAVTKFSSQDADNRRVLFELDAIAYILPHVEHNETNIKRFALKALAQLCQLPGAPELVLANKENVRKISRLLVKLEDVFVLEFASLVLAELTRELEGCEQVIGANIMNTLFNRMKNSLDPDVQKNCLQVLSNLLADPVCASEVTKSSQFSWPSLLALMQSKFLAIQHAAINTVDQLVRRYKDEVIQRSFRASTGVLDLVDILESYEFRDVHQQVLEVLRNYVETEENAVHFYRAGCILRLLAYLEMALPAMKAHCLAVLTEMSHSANGRQALYETGTDLVFCSQLLSSSAEQLADAALGVASMTRLLASAVRMADTNVIEALCAILGDDGAAWFDIRLNALRALAELCRVIPKAAYSLVEPRTFAALRNINRRPKDSPVEAQRLAVQCCINLQNYHLSTQAMLNAEFVQELLNILQRNDISLKVMACEVLCGLMTEPVAKELLTQCAGEGVVAHALRVDHIGLRTALCRVVALSVTDRGAERYLEEDAIHYMVRNKQVRYVCPAWESALEAIFNHHPSAKLAYTGRLEINNLTEEGFYVTKRLQSCFPALRHLMAERCSPRSPVYFCSFGPPLHEDASFTSSSGSVKSRGGSRASTAGAAVAGRPRATRSPLSVVSGRGAGAGAGEEGAPGGDPHLRLYLVKLRLWFGDATKSYHIIELTQSELDVRSRQRRDEISSAARQRARILGEFVAEQMCGLTRERDCTPGSVDLHVNELKLALESNVIPLGSVRAGGALERSVLYKVLADRVAIPCALVRATSARAWVEVAVPERDPEEEMAVEEHYPAGLLRANYVVDLLQYPGRLLRLGSHEARGYCGEPGARRYFAGEPDASCRCHLVTGAPPRCAAPCCAAVLRRADITPLGPSHG